jgi:hypothetical protein
MIYFVILSDNSQRILRVMARKPVIARNELAVRLGLNWNTLDDALQPLLSAGTISANSAQTYFNLNPSARAREEWTTR